MIGGLLGLVVGVLVGCGYVVHKQAEVYEQMISLLETDREAARNEAKLFRNILYPAMGKHDTPPAAATEPAPTLARPAGFSLFNRRQPFKLRFKQNLRATNSKQQRTDALADALSKQAAPENTHA